MKKKFKIGVVGSGYIANKFHIPSFLKNKKVKELVLCDENESNLKKTAKKFNIKSYYTNFDEMISKKNIEILNICTPPSSHYKYIINAIKNKMHIFVEKPFVTSLKQFDKIRKKLKKGNIHCYCAYHQRSRPVSELIKKLIKEKKIGEIYYINIVYRQFRSIPKHSKFFSEKKYSGGGPLIDLGSHFFDLVGWFMNFPKVKKVSNYCFDNISKIKNEKKYLPFNKFDNEEFSVGNIKLENGCVINYELSYVLNTKEKISYIELFGTKGMIKWPDGEITEIRNNQSITKKMTVKNLLASQRQVNNFIDNLSNKFSLKYLNEIRYTVSLIDKLYNWK